MHNKKLMRTAAGIVALVLVAGIPVAANMNGAAGNSIRKEYVKNALQTKAAHVSRIVAADAQAKEEAKAAAEAKAKEEAKANETTEPAAATEPAAGTEASAEPIYAVDVAEDTGVYDTVTETAAEPAYTEEYVSEEPVYEEPVYEEPVYEEPVYEEPVYEEPVYEEPVYEEPVYDDGSGDTETADAEWQEEETYTESTAETEPRTEASGTDLDLLASLIYCEAGGESHEGQVAVGAVVLNRMESDLYPDSMSDVIYQDWQFTPAATGWLDQVRATGAPDYCYEAAQAALNGENPVGDCLYFHAGGGDGLTIGNQTFY